MLRTYILYPTYLLMFLATMSNAAADTSQFLKPHGILASAVSNDGRNAHTSRAPLSQWMNNYYPHNVGSSATLAHHLLEERFNKRKQATYDAALHEYRTHFSQKTHEQATATPEPVHTLVPYETRRTETTKHTARPHRSASNSETTSAQAMKKPAEAQITENSKQQQRHRTAHHPSVSWNYDRTTNTVSIYAPTDKLTQIRHVIANYPKDIEQKLGIELTNVKVNTCPVDDVTPAHLAGHNMNEMQQKSTTSHITKMTRTHTNNNNAPSLYPQTPRVSPLMQKWGNWLSQLLRTSLHNSQTQQAPYWLSQFIDTEYFNETPQDPHTQEDGSRARLYSSFTFNTQHFSETAQDVQAIQDARTSSHPYNVVKFSQQDMEEVDTLRWECLNCLQPSSIDRQKHFKNGVRIFEINENLRKRLGLSLHHDCNGFDNVHFICPPGTDPEDFDISEITFHMVGPGTFAQGSQEYHDPNGGDTFTPVTDRAIEEASQNQPTMIASYDWNGKNHMHDRIAEAEQMCNFSLGYGQFFKKLIVYLHSHGVNVEKIASREAEKQAKGSTRNITLVSLAGPIRRELHSDYLNIANTFHFYSVGDPVQIAGGVSLHKYQSTPSQSHREGVTGQFKQWYEWLESFRNIFNNRTDESHNGDGPNVYNIEVYIDGKAPGHSEIRRIMPRIADIQNHILNEMQLPDSRKTHYVRLDYDTNKESITISDKNEYDICY